MAFDVDFTPLANLARTYADARAKALRAGTLAGLADTTDPAAFDRAGRRLIAAGDLREGIALADLGRKFALRAPPTAPDEAQPGLAASPRLGRDGHVYVPDPQRPGRYLRVNR
jgi:hypothetical protein